MAAFGFRPARTAGLGDSSVAIQSMRYDSAQTFKLGAVLTLASDGEVVEASADPTAIYGVALQDAGSAPGYGMSHDAKVTVRTGVNQEVSVALARGNIFKGRAVNGGTDPVVPLQTHIGESYGIAKVSDEWVIDIAETSALVVEIIDFVPAEGAGIGFFIFRFLDDVIAAAS
jgi:hypothetical protein